MSQWAFMWAQEASATDLPAKRPKEEDNGANMETDNSSAVATDNGGGETKESACMSSVIRGWFSEMSPMWPGVGLLEKEMEESCGNWRAILFETRLCEFPTSVSESIDCVHHLPFHTIYI